MAWTAGSDVTTGDLITAAAWNTYMGASGSLEYLKTEADKMDDVSQVRYTSANKSLGTNYQNTSGKIRIVTVTIDIDNGSGPVIEAFVEIGDATPDVLVAKSEPDNATGDIEFITLSFAVPPTAYYRVDGSNCTIRQWVEWDLH